MEVVHKKGKEDSVSFRSDEIPIPKALPKQMKTLLAKEEKKMKTLLAKKKKKMKTLEIAIEEGDLVRSSYPFPIRDPFSSPTWGPGSYSISEDALRRFRIVGGVPIMLPPQQREDDFVVGKENSDSSLSDHISQIFRGRTVRDYVLESLASKTGKTVDEVDMDLLAECGNLGGTNWPSKSEWITANVDGGDRFPRLNVKIVSRGLQIDTSPRGRQLRLQQRKIIARSEKFGPVYELDEFFEYSCQCDKLCQNLRPDNLQPGNVTYFVSIPSIEAEIFCSSFGHPIAVVAERVSFAAARKQKKDSRKRLIRGEMDITFHSSHPFNLSTLTEKLQVEGVLVRAEGHEVEVRVDFIVVKTGKLEYSARTTLYSTLDPAWMVKDTEQSLNNYAL